MENQTKKEIIDKQLLAAGWDITDCTQVIEAKKTSKDGEADREQAKQYCYNIQKQYNCRLPLCFYTNGFEIFFWDLENYPPRKIIGYPTRDDLERYHYIKSNKKLLDEILLLTKDLAA
ncbi:MAG: hypothetical protein K8S13_13880 [Desulfobacula sp.]|uniref:hypothetical protein n=1 Tax=Desulfobacula sp. TaxID=2593537 RepID=UPI0025B829DA|nr:hypothetical protein [Desulfobacula sp.]MCD4720930.1 hypothetical protein [Desulfobacula sp.]